MPPCPCAPATSPLPHQHSTMRLPPLTPLLLPTAMSPAPAVCAKFEQEHERFPNAADAPALAALKASVCAEAGVDPAALPDDQLAAYAGAEADMPAINAVVGGVLSNEVIKAAGGRDAPFNNFFLFSLTEGMGTVEKIA